MSDTLDITKAEDRESAEQLLEQVQCAQSSYWEALNRLENALGIDLDSTEDYSTYVVDDLL